MSPHASIIDINESNLHQTLEQSMQLPVLFYFWSERRQHCQQLTPVLERLAQEYAGQFILARLDCDDKEQMVASQFGLHSIPTVYLFQNGQPSMASRDRNRKRRFAPCWKKSCRVKKS